MNWSSWRVIFYLLCVMYGIAFCLDADGDRDLLIMCGICLLLGKVERVIEKGET